MEHSTILVREELKLQEDTFVQNERLKRNFAFIEVNNVEVILPLNRRVQLNGVVLLGAKNTRLAYTQEDLT